MRKIIFEILKLGLNKLTHSVSPSRDCMKSGELIVKNFEKSLQEELNDSKADRKN